METKSNVAVKAVQGRRVLNVGQIFHTRRTKVAIILFVGVVALFKAADLYVNVLYQRYLFANNSGEPNSWLGWKEYVTPCSSDAGCGFGHSISHENALGRYSERTFIIEVESRFWFKRCRFLDYYGKPIQKDQLIKPGGTW